MNKNKDIKKVCMVAIVLATIVSMYLRIFYGWDQDESYVVLLADKIAEGKKLFKDLWDLHQTSAIFTAFFCRLYLIVTGTTEGIGIYLRFISVLIQTTVAIFGYRILKKHISTEAAFAAAIVIANMLPRATQQFEYGTITIWAAIVTNLILLDAYYSDRSVGVKVILAAVSYSVSILAYPTMIISIPFYVFFLLKFKGNRTWKWCAVFGTTCLVLAAVFMAYVFSVMGIQEFAETLKAIGNSGDHTSLFSSFLNIDFWLKPILRIVVTVLIAAVISALLKKIIGFREEVLYVYMIVTTMIVLFLNITGIRPSGPYGFLERYIAVVLLAVPFIKKFDNKPVFGLFYVAGILYYIGSLMGSNLGLNENAMFLEIAVIAVVIIASQKANKIELIAVAIFVFGIAFSSGYFVRVNYTAPANFAQCTETFESGPLKGISVTEEQFENIANKIEVVENISEADKSYALLSNEPLYNFYIKGDTVAPRYVTTAKYNQQWIDYYEKFGHELPDILFVDTYWYPSIDDFYTTEFGIWTQSYYNVLDTGNGEFWVLERRVNND